jgi:hypothetical protein
MLNVEKRPEPTALEAKISALKYVNALIRERLDGASKDPEGWKKAAKAAQRLLSKGGEESAG